MGMPTCQQVAQQLSREQDEPLATKRRMALRLHLLMCHHCRRYNRQLIWLRTSIRRALQQFHNAQLSDPARARIRHQLAQQQRHDEHDK